MATRRESQLEKFIVDFVWQKTMHRVRLQLGDEITVRPVNLPPSGSRSRQGLICYYTWQHGRRSRADGGHVTRIWIRGTLMQIVPLRFCTKRSVLWPSKYTKIRFRPGLRPGPRWGSSRRSTPLVGWRGDTPLHTYPTQHRPTFGPSPCVPAMRPP